MPADNARQVGGLAVTLTVAALTLLTLLAVFNGVFGGGPFINGFANFIFGVEIAGAFSGTWRIAVILGFLLVLSWLLDFYDGADPDRDIKSPAPFWIGLGIIGLLLVEYVVPQFVLESLGFLGLIEFFLGIPLEELDPVRTSVLGVSFLVVFYAVRARLGAELDGVNVQAASTPRGVAYQVGQGFIGLWRSYQKTFIVIAGATSTLAILSLNGASEVFFELFGFADAPVWSGYLGTLSSYYVNFFTDWLPFELTPWELGLVFLTLFALTVAIWQQ